VIVLFSLLSVAAQDEILFERKTREMLEVVPVKEQDAKTLVDLQGLQADSDRERWLSPLRAP